MVAEPMLTTEYIIHGPTDLTIAIVADLHEHDPSHILSILKEVSPDVIAVPGDLFVVVRVENTAQLLRK